MANPLRPSRLNFTFLVILAQIVGVCAVIMMAVWMGNYRGGFGWGYKNSNKFNYHPLFMTLGLIFLYGDAMLVYRVFRKEKKIIVKVLHMLMQLAALGFASTALYAVFSIHNEEGFANLYSLHSWIGLATVIMFGLQFLLGFIFYLFPTASESLKQAYMSVHRFWGVTIFCMAIAVALMGIMENVGFKVKDYKDRPPEAYVINFLGLFIVIFGWIVTFLVTRPEYQREDNSSEYMPQLNH